MESRRFFLLAIAATVFCCLIGHSISKEMEGIKVDLSKVKTCGDVIKEIGKGQVSAVGACSKQLNFKNAKEKKERANCIMKCVMQNAKVLAPNGKFDMKLIQEMIDEFMPPTLAHLREKGEAMFLHCKNEHEPNLDNDELTCKSYGPLIKCLMGLMSLCNE